jgi:PKD repeat protein
MLVAYNACGQDTQLQNILIPEFEANFSADKSIGCAPLTVNFSSDTPYRTHNHFYTFPGGTPAFAYTQTGDKTIVYNTPGVFDVSMIAYTQALAESDTLLKSGYITVLPSPNPNMEISLLQIDQSVQLSTDFETGIDYAWLISTGDTLAGPNAAYTFDQPGVYEVILSASNQCGVVFDTVQINVEGVEAAFAVSQTIGCAPFTVQFDNTTAVVVDSVHWYFPGGSPSFSTEQNPSVMYNEPGEYDVRQVAFANGLRDTLDSPALLRVLPNDCPMVQVFAQVNGLGATLWTNCQQGNQYTWDLGDGAVFHTQGIAYQYDSAGVYEVRLIVEGLCGTDTATLTLDITDPLGATTAVSGTPVAVLLRPNPARDLVLLEFQPGLPADRDMEIRLLNKVGRKVLHRKNENANSVALPLHEIPAGVYQLQWKLDDQPWRVRKLVVVK